ncbi:unnamed protein product [Orchesella dallaii]|uniref:Uncharacterized protein n=1 Tax=Orchesella dallaii TaxID=48710 RepID=A0ABP1QFR2_9HEXA
MANQRGQFTLTCDECDGKFEVWRRSRGSIYIAIHDPRRHSLPYLTREPIPKRESIAIHNVSCKSGWVS